MSERQRRHMLEVIPLLVIALAAAAFVLLTALEYGRLERELRPLKSDWSLNGEAQSRLPSRDLRSAGEESRIRRTLDADFAGPRTLCFNSVYETVRVYLDGEEIYRFDKPPGERLMRAAPSYWNRVDIPAGSEGRALEIVLATPYQQYANVLPQIWSGSAEQVQRYVFFRTVSRFVAALAILFVGLIFAVVAVVMRYYVVGSTGLYSLSLFIVMLAVFLAAQQTTILLALLPGISYIMLQSVAFMLCPALYTRYLIRVQKGGKRSIAMALHALSILNCALILALQIFGVRDMPQMMSYTRNLCAVVIIYVFLLELMSKKRLLVCAFALLMIYASFRYYFTDSITWLVYAGIFIYLYILIYRVIASVVSAEAKQIRLEAALQVSRSEIAAIQITSHFFYHTLDSIRALIRIDPDRAYKMTGDFAKYVRHRVDGVERMQEPVPFSRELRAIRAYADIKQAQLGERFEMIYDVETEDFEILPLTVQPLVENAVIHAVQLRRGGGRVRLVCRETNEGYHIEVVDNGPGAVAPQETAEAQKESSAVKNVNTRLEFYGIAPLRFEKNAEGGMTVSLDTPKKIKRKEDAQ